MKPFLMSELTTKDGLRHQGIFAAPAVPKKKAVLWLHGLSAAFYNDYELYEVIADALNDQGYGFAIFNNRGHDLIAGIRKYDGSPPNGYTYYPGGAGSEVFEECIFDINAGVDFLVQKGFTEIILVGHSTGANKACYYAATESHPSVSGVVLAGCMSDRLGHPESSEQIQKHIDQMKQKISDGKGDELLFGYHFFPITPKRYISLFNPGSSEDTFDYGDINPKMTAFSRIRIPLMVLLGGADEYADRPITQIKSVFDSHATSSRYHSVVIPDALHKFHGKEIDVATALVSWINGL
jgi:alpha-beta hydrolase superfamily lysophospholipase